MIMAGSPSRILVAEDDPDILELLRDRPQLMRPEALDLQRTYVFRPLKDLGIRESCGPSPTERSQASREGS